MGELEPIKFNTPNDRVEKKARSPYKKPSKDFSKVLARDRDRRRDEEDDKKVKEGDDKKSTRKPKKSAKGKGDLSKDNISLFDLAKHVQEDNHEQKGEDKGEGHDKEKSEDFRTESYAALLKQTRANKFKDKTKTTTSTASTQPNGTSQFAQEQPDLTTVNPAAAQTSASAKAHDVSTAKAVEMAQLAEKMIEKLQIIAKSGQTETTITLRHPPMFEGARLVVTSFDSAKGEFNLKFENLSNQGKQILDLEANQNALRMALDQKGYVVHIMTTTTFEEPHIAIETEPSHRGEKEPGQDQEGQQEEREEG